MKRRRLGRCHFCTVPFKDTDVPKNVKLASGDWKKACRSCAKDLGVEPLTNIIAHPPKNKEQEDRQGKLFDIVYRDNK
jgi:hypothetical protein